MDLSFFVTRKTGAPQGDALRQMNLLSRSSRNGCFNSFNSIGAIRYNALEIGANQPIAPPLGYQFLQDLFSQIVLSHILLHMSVATELTIGA